MKRSQVIRQIFSLALVVMLLALIGAPALAASNANPGGAYVVSTTTRLNVRSGPWEGVIQKLPKGSVVVYKGQSKGWWKVMYAGGTGYVDRRYLTSVDAYAGTKFAPVTNLYVRIKPSTSSWSVGKIKQGLKVTYLKQQGTWMYISYKGNTGWVASKYMKKA